MVSIRTELKLKVGIESYLATDRCSTVLLEHGADVLFNECLQASLFQRPMPILSGQYTGHRKDALGLFIERGVSQPKWPTAFVALLKDYAHWRKASGDVAPDYGEIIEALLELGVAEDVTSVLRTGSVRNLV